MAIEALPLGGEDFRAAIGRGPVAGLVGGHQHEFDHIADFARLERWNLVALVGLSLGKGRHVGEIPTLRIAGPDAMQDGVLDLGDPALAVKPCRTGEIGHTVTRIALKMVAMTRGAAVVIDRLRIAESKTHELGTLQDGIGFGAHQPRPHRGLPGQVGGGAGDDEDREPYPAPGLPSQPITEPTKPAARRRIGVKRSLLIWRHHGLSLNTPPGPRASQQAKLSRPPPNRNDQASAVPIPR